MIFDTVKKNALHTQSDKIWFNIGYWYHLVASIDSGLGCNARLIPRVLKLFLFETAKILIAILDFGKSRPSL